MAVVDGQQDGGITFIGRMARALCTPRTLVCILLLVLFTVLRVILAAGVPMAPFMIESYDDALLVSYAKSFADFSWLGPYNKVALTKNPGFSLALALFYRLGVSYQVGFCLLYVCACIVCCCAFSPLVRSKKVAGVLYICMLYAPYLFEMDYVQRVYRMGFDIPLVMILFAAYMAIYLRCESGSAKKLMLWAIAGGIGLSILSLVKENSMWAMPFVAVCSVVIVAKWVVMLRRGQMRGRGIVCRALVILIPLAMFFGATSAVKAVNNAKYGLPLTNDRYDGPFAQFSKEIVSIDAQNNHDTVWVSRDALRMAFANSPKLAQIEKEVWDSWRHWTNSDEVELTGDIPYWALRDAYTNAGGYKDPATTAQYWTDVANELNAAFESGALPKKQGLVISAPSQPIPWDGLANTLAESIRMGLSLCMHEEARLRIVPWATEPLVGNGDAQKQQYTTTLVGGNAIMGTTNSGNSQTGQVEGEIANPEVLEAHALIINVNHVVGKVSAVLAPWVFVATCVGAIVLLVLDVRERNRDGVRTALILAALVLSGFVFELGVNWAMKFVGETSYEFHRWAMFSYSADFYGLLILGEYVVIGRLCGRLLGWVHARGGKARLDEHQPTRPKHMRAA